MVDELKSRMIGFVNEKASALQKLLNRESEPEETEDCDIDYHDLSDADRGLVNKSYFGSNKHSTLTASRRAALNKQI